MDFYSKILQIEKLLPNRTRKEIQNRLILATGIYFKIRMKVSFREIPLNGISYSWSSFRRWMQKLKRNGKLEQIQKIVGGEET